LAPAVLEQVLNGLSRDEAPQSEKLLVGNDSRDDAAVYLLDENTGLIATTDFFMPVVDDPFAFGQVAATNAISDVFAMGGRPIMALGILGWPQAVLAPEIATEVLRGGRSVCDAVGIPLAGGHSIDSPEPIFGLAVNGIVRPNELKRNVGARPGDQLVLTKPLGIGLYTTAQKRGATDSASDQAALELMLGLNHLGMDVAPLKGVHAQTDVTGYGLLGHLREMCEGSNVGARIDATAVPLMSRALEFVDAGYVPGGTRRNLEMLEGTLRGDARSSLVLADPQTSGGLLLAVSPECLLEVQAMAEKRGCLAAVIGQVEATDSPFIEIEGVCL